MLESMVSLHSHVTRLGVLDIGSNTVHMLIVDAAPGARPEPEASTKSTVRLMQYLKADGTIKKAGVEAVVAAVEKAMGLVKEYEITQLLVLATSALREAPNGSRILKRIENVVGQPVTVLSGVDEARLTFLAARRWYGWDAGRLLVIDIGGGSLEVAMGSDEDPTVALSVPAGAGRVTREFLPENGIANDRDLEDAAGTSVRFLSRWSRRSRNRSTRCMPSAHRRPFVPWLVSPVPWCVSPAAWTLRS